MSDYKEDLKINLKQLHRDWQNHPLLYAKWAERHATAMSARDRAKEQVEMVKGERSLEFLENWEDYFDKKPTVAAIESRVVQDEEYRRAINRYMELCEEVNVLAVAKTAFEHRKRALDNEVKLYLGEYFSKEDLGADDKVELQKKERNAKVAKKRRVRK